ncbi:MAG: GntR family transcriptional regulator [Rhodobacteraceae bacterium]|jgi:GntR family transcriptional regulator|nr:GntR family transcriptional regulator [Paracoccaceae bacterium]
MTAPAALSNPLPNALPLYVRISEMLIREIMAGRLIEGERLPPEREMAASLGIAVGTLRKALADLEGKGLLDRVQGSGNYVRHRPEVPSLYAMFRLELAQGGGLPTAEILSVDRLPKPEGAPGFGPSPDGHRIRRLRRLSGVPVAAEEIWLDGGRAERIAPADLSESLYYFYRTRLGFWIARAEDRVTVAPAPDWAPAAFGPRPGTPCGHVERIAWAQDGAPCEFSRTWFDADLARYVQRLR